MERLRKILPELAGEAEGVAYFTCLGEDAAARYLEIRDGMLEGLNPNDGSIDWATYQERVAQADQTAREIVGSEMIYLPD